MLLVFMNQVSFKSPIQNQIIYVSKVRSLRNVKTAFFKLLLTSKNVISNPSFRQ